MIPGSDAQHEGQPPEVRPEPSYQVEKLRDAADYLGRAGMWSISLPIRVPDPWEGGTTITRAELPDALCVPLRSILRAAAENIERSGSTLGLPVNHALRLAGVILGEDLGHNR